MLRVIPDMIVRVRLRVIPDMMVRLRVIPDMMVRLSAGRRANTTMGLVP